MGLKVWLPLNGDLHNQGLTLLPNTSVNTFTYSNGKIGQCATGRAAWHLDEEILGNTWSVAMWVNPGNLGSANNILFCKNSTSSTDCHIYFSIISTTQLNIGVNGPSSSVTATGQSFSTGVWYHVAATYDGTIATVYLNGIELKHGTVTTACPTGRLNMNINGRSTNAANTGTTGNITCSFNDFRLYDHCLSAAEVREISQGLILHYQLNAHNLINKSTLTSNNYINASGGLTSTSGWYASDYISIIPGHTYQTFDLSHGGSNTRIAFYDINKTYKRNVTIVANENLTLTAAEGEAYMRVSIRNLANELQIASVVEVPNIIQDSSGYNHNGILNDTTAKISTDTQRYSVVLLTSQANNSATYPIKGECNMPESNALTFAWWMKPTTIGYQTSGLFSTSNNDLPTDYLTTAVNMYDSVFQCCNTSGTYKSINVASYLTTNEWHHYALTYNGATLAFYKDGALKNSTTQTGALKAFKYIFPFYSKAGGGNRTTSGSLSDFRIYCTALDANAIRQLYEVGAKVDNKGNLHTYELNESGANQLTKTGIIKDYMVEPYMKLSDGSYWKLLLYHIVDNGTNLFTSSNAAYNNGFGLYSRLRDIDGYQYDNKYEFYVLQDDIPLRWTQTNAPMTTTAITGFTAITGSPGGGICKCNGNTVLAASSTTSNWWRACGCYKIYNGGIPGFGSNVICKKYLALYARIPKSNFELATQNAYAENFIEI